MTEEPNSTSFNTTLFITSIFMYMSAILLVFPSGNVEVYGFKVQLSFMQVLEAILQVGPLLMAFCSLLTAPMRDKMISKLAGSYATGLPAGISRLATAFAIIQVHLLMAVIFATITLVPVFLNITRVEMLSNTLTGYIAVSLIYDLTIIGIFVHFLFCLFRQWWAVWLSFIIYVLVVIFIGPLFGITKLIGFASTSLVVMTGFNDLPLYFEQASAYRLYWGLVTCVMLYLLTVGKNQQKGLLPGIKTIRLRTSNHQFKTAVLGVIVVATMATANLILQAQNQQPQGNVFVKESDKKQINNLALSHDRAILEKIDLRLDFNNPHQKMTVDAKLDFKVAAQSKPLKVVALQLPQLFDVNAFSLTTGQTHNLIKYQGHYYLEFKRPLAPNATFTVNYSASTPVDGHFSSQSQTKIMTNAAFLSSPDFLMQSRSSWCTVNQLVDLEPHSELTNNCFDDENYLLADKINGHIEFIANKNLKVLTIGKHSSQPIDENRTRHQFAITRAQFAVFSLSAAEFQTHSMVSNGITINVHGSPTFKSEKAVKLATAIDQIIAFYAPTFGKFDHNEIHLIEQPSHLGEAVSFDNTILFSEQILSTLATKKPFASQDKNKGKEKAPLLNQLTSFVLAHEVSHHWFGYKLVPQKQPGQDFLLESFAQYLAYSYLDNQQTMPLQTALDNEKARYCKSVTRMNLDDNPLHTIENQSHLAYHKGAYALLLLDKMLDQKLLSILGEIVRNKDNLGATNATGFSQLLLKRVPEDVLLAAQNLLLETQSQLQLNCTANKHNVGT